ncbi:MAG: hypothetical protein HS108_05235 [Planctomycetes bacterium]|jgi:hypothetical protein|nr:hypothetical protein [Planctomycetota bacterium]MCL4731855.1 hypothetical protein [Planctomycetota bacterium]
MSPKMALLVGLMMGVLLAVAASVVTLVMVGSTVKERESRAYQAGLDDGAGTARFAQGKVGDVLNAALVDENAASARRIAETKTKLKELLAQDTLPEPAKAKAQEALDALGP